MFWSKIYEKEINDKRYRVIQHPHLQVFNIETYGECDNPQSWGRHNDWYCLKQVRGIDEVNRYFKENIWSRVC